MGVMKIDGFFEKKVFKLSSWRINFVCGFMAGSSRLIFKEKVFLTDGLLGVSLEGWDCYSFFI